MLAEAEARRNHRDQLVVRPVHTRDAARRIRHHGHLPALELRRAFRQLQLFGRPRLPVLPRCSDEVNSLGLQVQRQLDAGEPVVRVDRRALLQLALLHKLFDHRPAVANAGRLARAQSLLQLQRVRVAGVGTGQDKQLEPIGRVRLFFINCEGSCGP